MLSTSPEEEVYTVIRQCPGLGRRSTSLALGGLKSPGLSGSERADQLSTDQPSSLTDHGRAVLRYFYVRPDLYQHYQLSPYNLNDHIPLSPSQSA